MNEASKMIGSTDTYVWIPVKINRRAYCRCGEVLMMHTKYVPSPKSTYGLPFMAHKYVCPKFRWFTPWHWWGKWTTPE